MMRSLVRWCQIFALCAQFSCRGTLPATTDLSEVERIDIAELVVRRLLDLSWQGTEAIVCVTIEGKVTSPEFVERFSDASVVVVSTVECSEGRSRENGKLIRLNVGAIEQLTEERASVDADYSIALLSGKGFTFRLERSEGSWRIISEETDWIAILELTNQSQSSLPAPSSASRRLGSSRT